MKYENCKLLEIYAEEGIVFVSIQHIKSKVKMQTFLGEHILEKLFILNNEQFFKDLEDYRLKNEEQKKIVRKDTIFLQMHMDLKKIYNEYI